MLSLLFCRASIELVNGARIPAYVAGTGLIFWGLLLLRKTGHLSRLWAQRLRRAMILAALSVYFAPFVVWWRVMPWTSFLVVNLTVFLLVLTSLLIVANMLVAELFSICRENGRRMESVFFAITAGVLLLLPLLIGFSSALVASIRYGSVLAEEIWMTLARVPAWLYASLTAPCALTMVALWKAGSFCAHCARHSADQA